MANIYQLEIGEESYIGSSCHLTKRLTNHKSRSSNSNYSGYNRKLYQCIRDIQWDNVKINILESCDPNIRKDREQHYIDILKPELNLYRAKKDINYRKKWDIKVECSCGGGYTKSHKARHLICNKHLNFISENNI